MNTITLPEDDQGSVLHDRIKRDIEAGNLIKIYNRPITSTKAAPETASIELRHLWQLEQDTKRSFPGLETINPRLSSYDPTYTFNQYPKHYPVQVVRGTGATVVDNVFCSFPKGDRLKDQLGLEFMDAWHGIYSQIIEPVIKKLFDEESIQQIFASIDSTSMGMYYFWTALAHEWGHGVGPYSIFPPTKGFLKLNPHLQGTFGETAANVTAALLTPERPEIALWILIFHIGFTGRKGFQADPNKGLINVDNDTCAAVLLSQRAIEDGALEVTSDRKLHLNRDCLLPCYAKLREETDRLASEAFKLQEVECNEYVYNWLKRQIPFDKDGFIFPDSLKRLYAQVHTEPEYPLNRPLLPPNIN